MPIVKVFNHSLHVVNYCRAMLKSELRNFQPLQVKEQPVPVLEETNSYYFIFEVLPRFDLNQVLWALCSFDADGVILFQKSGIMPVSCHRYIRQGLSRTAAMIEGVIKGVFRRQYIPLKHENPFVQESEGLYRCNISWCVYQSFKSI